MMGRCGLAHNFQSTTRLTVLFRTHVTACSYLAGEEGFEPSHAGIKIRCLNQLGDSPTRVGSFRNLELPTDQLSLEAQPFWG